MERINATLDFLQQSEKKWMNTGQSHKSNIDFGVVRIKKFRVGF